MSRFPFLTGLATRRVNGARFKLLEQAAACTEALSDPTISEQFAASLRGKRKAYTEAADLLARVDRGGRINGRRRP